MAAVSHAMRRYPPGPLEAPPQQPPFYMTATNQRNGFMTSPDPNSKAKKTWGQRLKLAKNGDKSPTPPVHGDGALYGTINGQSALSRSMKYAETWLYGTVRGAPMSQAPPQMHPSMFAPFPEMAVVVCSCPEYLTGTKRSYKKATVCKKCRGSRLPLAAIGGTVRTHHAPSVVGTVRGGTVRMAPTAKVRPTILNVNKQSDPYDLMRRSRLVPPEPPPVQRSGKDSIRSRAKSISPSRGRVRKRSPTVDQNVSRSRSASRSQEAWGLDGDSSGRKSILECDVNPYDLISKNGFAAPDRSPTEDDVFGDSADELNDNAFLAKQTYSNGKFDVNSNISQRKISSSKGITAIGGQRIRVFGESRTPSADEDYVYEPIDIKTQMKQEVRKTEVKSVSNNIESNLPRFSKVRSISPKRPPRRSRSEYNEEENESEINGDDTIKNTVQTQGPKPNNSETSLGLNRSKQQTSPTVIESQLERVQSPYELHSIKSILKKPRESPTFNDTVSSTPEPRASSPAPRTSPATGRRISGSHFYLPTPSPPTTKLTPRKKVQFLVENEMIQTREDTHGDNLPSGNAINQSKVEIKSHGKPKGNASHKRNNESRNSIKDATKTSDSKVPASQESAVAIGQHGDILTVANTSSPADIPAAGNLHIDDLDVSTPPHTGSRLRRSFSDRVTIHTGVSKETPLFHDTTALRLRSLRFDARQLFDNSEIQLQSDNGLLNRTRSRPQTSPPSPPSPPLTSTESAACTIDHATDASEIYLQTTGLQTPVSSSLSQPHSPGPGPGPGSTMQLLQTTAISSHSQKSDISTPQLPPAPSPPPRHIFPFTKRMFEESSNAQRSKTTFIELLANPSEDTQHDVERDMSNTTASKDKLSNELKTNYRNPNIKLDVTLKPNRTTQRTVVQVSPDILMSPGVHRLQVKHETNHYDVIQAQKKTSILITGDECYSTVNVSDDMPIYQSSVVVNDGTSPGIVKTPSNTVTISVSSPRTPEEEIIYNNNKRNMFLTQNSKSVIPVNLYNKSSPTVHEVPAYASSAIFSTQKSPGSTFVNLDYDISRNINASQNSTKTTFAEVQQQSIDKNTPDNLVVNVTESKVPKMNNTTEDEHPTPEELGILLRDPVEAVRRNLVPHVCGKSDDKNVIRQPNSRQNNEAPVTTVSPNSFVAKLLEDPTLGHLVEGLENDLVTKLIENSLIRLKESRTTLDTSGTQENDDMTKMIDMSLQKIKEERNLSTPKENKHIAPVPTDEDRVSLCSQQDSIRNSLCSGTNSNRNSLSSAPYESLDYEGVGQGDMSDCYQSSASEITVEEDGQSSRSKFYQMLVDATLSEIENSTNTDDDHHYESIRLNGDPIYEEIGDVPPPLPLSPPPNNLDDDLDKKYTSRSIFEGASKYDILSYLVDAKERGIVPEESYTYNFSNTSDIVIEEEEENKVTESHQRSNSDLSSRVSHLSNASDSSEDSSLSNLIITTVPNDKVQPNRKSCADVERNDSGVGSETSKSSRSRWQSHNGPPVSKLDKNVPLHLCEDCDGPVETQVTDSGVMYAPLVCRKCGKKRAERKEIITEIVETEEKYGRDLQIVLEEFYQPMLVAGLLTQEQLTAIFLNTEELLENNQTLAERLRDSLEIASDQGDEDLLTVNIGKVFVEAAPMLHAFESYCIRQGAASLLLANLEKDKELLRIFLRVSQMENTVLRRMNLNSFLMVPVQRVTKYPLLLARLYKVTPGHHEGREMLKQAQQKIELHLNHMNSEAKDIPTKLWRRISIANNGRRSSSEIDMINIKIRKMAVDVLEWNHDEARFAMEGKLLFTQPTDNNWRKGRTIKLTHINALLVTNGKPSTNYRADRAEHEPLSFPRHTGIREASLLLVKEKGGRYTLLREPLFLDRCVVCSEPDWDDCFEVQEIISKDTFIFKAEDSARTKQWYAQLQYHAQGMGAWRKRRNALANIMINGMMTRT